MVSSKNKQRRPLDVRENRASNNRNTSDSVDYEALARFRYELRKFQAFSKTAAIKTGLTPQQHQALLTIRGFFRSAILRNYFSFAIIQRSSLWTG